MVSILVASFGNPHPNVHNPTLFQRLSAAAQLLSPAERGELSSIFRAPFVDLATVQLPAPLEELLATYSLAELHAAYDAHPALMALIPEAPEALVALPRPVRAELVRQKLLAIRATQFAETEEVMTELWQSYGADGLGALIAELTDLPVAEGFAATMSPLDLPDAATPEQNRFARALTAIKLHFEDVALRQDLLKFVIGIINPRVNAKLSDISDVYGSEADVAGAETDATRIRAREHWREVFARYGVNFHIVNQGTTIRCPEQCGFYALLGLNQARRAHRGNRMITTEPRFFLLNNAARVSENDGLEGGAEAQSSGLLWFELDFGDGIPHFGTAYGHRTLTHLKPYIKRLYEIEGTDRGTQFRSLEFQKHLGAISAMADGAMPLMHGIREFPMSVIPELNLAANQAQYLGYDKYGNGLTSAPAQQIFEQFLAPDQSVARVIVTIYERDGHTVHIGPKIYTLARSLGLVRDGGNALWESSSPQTEDPTRGFMTIGKFMKKAGEVNTDVLKIYPGCIVQIDGAEALSRDSLPTV